MGRCLNSRDIEQLLSGTASARKEAVARRHAAECQTCAQAVAESETNEGWLEGLREAREVADLRDKLRYSAAQQHVPSTALTDSQSTRNSKPGTSR